jgi:KDO2-lipid IV(A) lauroyltransferase
MKHPLTLLLDLTSALLGGLSERGTIRLANVMSAFWWTVLRYRRRIILENIERAFPQLRDDERRALGKRAVTHLSLSLLELFRIPHYVEKGFGDYVRLEGFENLDESRKAGKGVLILAGHLGSFELCVAAGAHRAAPIALVVKPFPAPVDAFINRSRRSAGLGIISAKNAIKPILQSLKKDGCIVFALDQNATRAIGVFVDFFGHTASTMATLAALAVRTKAPVIAAVPYREPDGSHVLVLTPPIPLEEKATLDETILHMTQVYTHYLETKIKDHPEQWFWTHKRWKTKQIAETQPEIDR